MAFAEFMASPLGRGLRVVFGGLLIYVGLNRVQGVAGTVIALLGLVPIVTGLLNLCVLGPLLGAPFRGSEVRAASRPAPPRG
jgi:Protein of unknown function (DUF2892)